MSNIKQNMYLQNEVLTETSYLKRLLYSVPHPLTDYLSTILVERLKFWKMLDSKNKELWSCKTDFMLKPITRVMLHWIAWHFIIKLNQILFPYLKKNVIDTFLTIIKVFFTYIIMLISWHLQCLIFRVYKSWWKC